MSDVPSNSPKSTPRGAPRDEAPYVWQSAIALRQIREQIGHVKGASAIAVYVGMTVIANDEGAATFTVKIARIASMATLSYRTTIATLEALEKAGVITIQPNGRSESGSTYTLLSFCNSRRTSLGKNCTRGYANDEALRLPTSSNKFPQEGTKGKEREAALPAPAPNALGAHGAEPSADHPKIIVQAGDIPGVTKGEWR